MNFLYPNREDLEEVVNIIEEMSKKDSSLLQRIFNSRDKDDKTVVFDYVDDYWFDSIHSDMAKVSGSSLYDGDGTIEYKIAYICIDINLLHRFPNGNKRSSLLALFVLLHWNYQRHTIIRLDWNKLYDMAKKISKEGAEGREKNIDALKECLQSVG